VLGDGAHGELGGGSTINTPTVAPSAVSGVSNAAQVVVGSDLASAAVTADGRVHVWGRGQLNFRFERADPIDLSDPVNVTKLSMTENTACAAISDGTVRCWGEGDHGQRGDGSFASTTLPVVVDVP
jgi:alpha-tubulin suppressor-like RCC1 family protein